MSHKQQYEASDVDYGTENFRTCERFDARIASGRKWAGSAGRRLNRSTVCIVGDVGKWLGNCAQDRRPWLRSHARGPLTLCAAQLLARLRTAAMSGR